MKHTQKRPPALVAIVVYKAFSASLLALTSIALLLTLKNYEGLADFAEDYALQGKIDLIEWVLEKLSNLNPKTIEFSGIAAGLYAVVTTIEAVGLWYQKTWAKILVLVLVGISIPPEIYELIKGVSLLKVVIFIANIAVFWYLFRHALDRNK